MIDLGIIIAILGSAVAIIGAMLALFLWLRTEANSDRRHFQDTQKEDRKDLISLHRITETSLSEHRKEMVQISKDTHALVYSIQLEMKDFHNRLLDIEKRK